MPAQQPQPSQPFYPPAQLSQPFPPGYYQSSQQYPMQGPYQPPYYPYQQPGWPPPRGVNRKADQAQMFGILSLLVGIFAIPAIILAVMALSEIQQTGEEGTGKANAGLLLGIMGIALVAAYYYFFILPH